VRTERRSALVTSVALILLLGAVVGLQAAREQLQPRGLPPGIGGNLLYVRSPEVMARAALSYRSLLADTYWIRSLQHYGRTKLADGGEKRYDLLYPLLDLTTSLDPKFNIAYRFGSIFLTEPPPGGPGRPDLAVALLKKGLAAQPRRWEYAQDIGFVYYRERDYPHAADWFRRAAQIDGAPKWLEPLEAVTRTRGGDRQTARTLWTSLLREAGAEESWMHKEAERRLQQLNALDDIDALEKAIKIYEARTGSLPASWLDMVRRGYLRAVPADPTGHPYELNPYWGLVTVDKGSPLNPLPRDESQDHLWAH
jgi:tetratricopeptide (TPR) repeat protein